MAGSDRWYFTKEVLANTPSRRCGIDSDKELSYRQQAANLIQDMGQRLHVSQLCINTAIVYMHRFYTFHSFTKFHRNSISSCALFLAAKVEEQPRKLEHVIKVSHMCLHRETPALDAKSEAYQEQAMELVFNENLMLQTLGFDIAVEHPHTSVVNCCQLVRASKDLAQTSYFMATNSLHLTTMCLQYKPTVVACVCIHLACKWSSWEIPRSSENKDWFFYIDQSVTLDLLEQLTSEFLVILDKCPSRLKRKILSGSGGNASATAATQNTSFSLHKTNDEKKSSSHLKEDVKSSMTSKSGLHQTNESMSSASRRSPSTSPLMKKSKTEQSSSQSQSNKIPVAMSYAAYRERKERANTQPEPSLKASEHSTKPNKTLTHPTARDMKEKSSVGAKLSSKQQQINIDKQKQCEERHKNKAKNSEFLFDNSTALPVNPSKPIPSSLHQKNSQNNITTEDFYENLLNKPSNFNSIFLTDGEDSFDFKREITTDLKMEFSDNSNQSNDGLNLTSFPSDFMNDSSESKKSLINSNNNNNNININPNYNNNCQTSADTKPTSFMSIFSTPLTNANPIPAPTVVPSKSENSKTGIASKYNDIQSVLSRIKPEPPPPMLSPLNSSAKVESVSKPEKQSFSSYSQSYVKTNSNLSSDLDLKQFSNSKVSKTSPKPRNPYNPPKNSIGLSVQSSQTFRDKEVNESSQNIKLEDNGNEAPIEIQTNINTNLNLNHLNNNCETIGSVDIRPEKPLKAAEVPSVLIENRPQPSNPYLEMETKTTVDALTDPKTLQMNPSATHNKEIREKVVQSPDEKPHKHSHHSHKSSKHKDKHKHKHKDKDRERHKRKDKDKDRDRDRDRERDREKHLEVCWSSPKDKPDVANNSNTGPIKLKISKKKLSVDEPDKDNDVPQNPLKLRIQLKDQKLTANPTELESNELGFTRKRKSSPKSSKKEKISKYETECNNSSKLKDDKSCGKTSKSKKSIESANAKKGSINSILDDKRSPHLALNSLGPMPGMPGFGQMGGQPVPQPTQRSSKAHK